MHDFLQCRLEWTIGSLTHGPVGVVVKDTVIGSGGLGFESMSVISGTESPTACHRCSISSKLCCPGAN